MIAIAAAVNITIATGPTGPDLRADATTADPARATTEGPAIALITATARGGRQPRKQLMNVRGSFADGCEPTYATSGSAGADLRACVDRPVVIAPGERSAVPTGVWLEIPPGYEGQVRPRSGLAARHGITVLNAPGTIDSDYRGEVRVIMINLSDEPYTVRPGDRIAQLVIASVQQATFMPAELTESDRGEGGFGSTGR